MCEFYFKTTFSFFAGIVLLAAAEEIPLVQQLAILVNSLKYNWRFAKSLQQNLGGPIMPMCCFCTHMIPLSDPNSSRLLKIEVSCKWLSLGCLLLLGTCSGLKNNGLTHVISNLFSNPTRLVLLTLLQIMKLRLREIKYRIFKVARLPSVSQDSNLVLSNLKSSAASVRLRQSAFEEMPDQVGEQYFSLFFLLEFLRFHLNFCQVR